MKLLRRLKVPTGDICVVEGERGLSLEFISVGDYGKHQNVKADFLGIKRPIDGVPHGELMPLSKKWVITISTQYGCSIGCQFCDVPKVGPGYNASVADMVGQVKAGIALHPEITHTDRLNVHFARMGEPMFNGTNVVNAARHLSGYFDALGWGYHPVLSTMMPLGVSEKTTDKYLTAWMRLKRERQGEAGLQISINTSESQARVALFNHKALSLWCIAEITNTLPVFGRKIALNFALTDKCAVDAAQIAHLFDPDKHMCKITPMHLTTACRENNVLTLDGKREYMEFYPYQQVEEDLKAAGFDVIVFVPSIEEDLGMITCGNVILSGRNPEVEYEEMEV